MLNNTHIFVYLCRYIVRGHKNASIAVQKQHKSRKNPQKL